MKEEMETFREKELRYLTTRTRKRLNPTQKKAEAKLKMCESFYSDIEIDKFSFVMPTAIMRLNLREASQKILHEFGMAFAECPEGRNGDTKTA